VSQADEQNFLTAFQAELDKQHDHPPVVGYDLRVRRIARL
jgi:hypothetical protein